MKLDIARQPDLARALDRLGDAARAHPHEPVILTRGDQPIAAYVPLDGLDAEAIAVSLSPVMHEVVARSRAQRRSGRSQAIEDVQRELGIDDEEIAAAVHKV
jgi:PHD/YefM family antitoxin component YafN of YafNO toxin-antitoxin module